LLQPEVVQVGPTVKAETNDEVLTLVQVTEHVLGPGRNSQIGFAEWGLDDTELHELFGPHVWILVEAPVNQKRAGVLVEQHASAWTLAQPGLRTDQLPLVTNVQV